MIILFNNISTVSVGQPTIYKRKELQYLIDNNVQEKGEYQLTNALENMKSKGIKFSPGQISEWLDCGNKYATVYTNQRILEIKSKSEKLVNDSAVIENSVIVPPCYIGAGVKIINSVVGPYASVGVKTVIKNSIVSNSIIQAHTKISNSNLTNSMVGNNAELEGRILDLSIGDFNSIKQ